jgi:ubiquinone/menaquinone biosynthesis C-methylase UbiE
MHMSVVFMKKLEQEPATYEQGFTALTGGINKHVQAWILDQLPPKSNVLEFGPGPGTLAILMGERGHVVMGIEKNIAMLEQARESRDKIPDISVKFELGDVVGFEPKKSEQDIVMSTFMLSELRPFEQQIYLRKAWLALKPGGKLLIADEFIPRGPWKAGFMVKRWWYKRKAKKLRTGLTHPLEWFSRYPAAIGFKPVGGQSWSHGAIKAMAFEKVVQDGKNEPGYYRPPPRAFTGVTARLRAWRCLLTGQMDHVSIEPGIYPSGTPGPNAPVLVTANYEYTYIRVMRDLHRGKVDAWVLVLDSDGINVWCGARGDHFGNKQLVEAVDATAIASVTSSRVLILPQLAAGGVEAPKLPRNTERFPFTVKYGPVWSKDLPAYLQDRPGRKPDKWKEAKFTIGHRMQVGFTHFTFQARSIFLLPTIALIVAGVVSFPAWTGAGGLLTFTGELWISLVVINLLLLGIAYPITRFTRKFIMKGVFVGVLNALVLGAVTWLLQVAPSILAWNTAFHFWLGYFTTMSFSGFTMDTSPREIAGEYVRFQVLNVVFLVLGITLTIVGLLVN